MTEGTDEFIMDSRVDDAIEEDYEFDAPQYFDLSQHETNSEAERAERWFESAVSDPPSPFIIKLNLGIELETTSLSGSCEDGSDATNCCTSSDSADTTMSYTVSTSSDGKFGGSVNQVTSNGRAKSKVKPTLARCSTLMKPTASHLAKLNQTLPLRRHQKTLSKNFEKSAQRSLSGENPASKRQKLEAGYLHRVAQVKHQLLLLHKVSKKTGSVNIISVRPKPKVTVPKEPELVTARRAQIRRLKKNVDSCSHAVSNANASKAPPSNRKVGQSSLFLPKRTTTEPSDFQVVRSSSFLPNKRITAQPSDFQGVNVPHTTSHQETSKSRRQSTVDASKQEKWERGNTLRSCSVNIKGLKSSSDKRTEYEPPVELFSKLSLASKPHNSRSQSKVSVPPKGSKENTMSSFRTAREMINDVKGKSERLRRKQHHCRSGNQIPAIRAQRNSNRSFRIH